MFEKDLKKISIKTWDRIERARNNLGVKVYETTLTQNLIDFLIDIKKNGDNSFQLFESLDETSNGNDIECFLKYDNGFLFFPIQAKIIYENGRYDQINHKVGKTSHALQIDLLREYAKIKKSIPLYILYSFSPDENSLKEIQEQVEFDYKCFGCSLISADFIEKKFTKMKSKEKIVLKPNFFDIHPDYVIPLFQFPSFNDSIFSKLRIDNGLSDYRKYTYSELINDENWRNLFGTVGVGKTYDPNDKLKNSFFTTHDAQNFFKPKYRIIIGEEELTTKIIMMY